MQDDLLNTIVKELKQGNNTCLRTIFEDHGDYCITNLRRKFSCSTEDAEDILTDAVLNFREKALGGQITFLTSIRNYIYTTCCNMWLAKYRKEKTAKEKTDTVRDTFYEEENTGSAEYKEGLIKTAYSALSALGERCQNILRLFYLERMSMTEIAEETGLANANVAKDAKARCYKKLITEAKKLTERNSESVK